MINMRSASAGSSNRIGGLTRIQSLIDLANLRSFDLQLQFFREICCKSILSRLDVAKPFNNLC